MRIPDSHRFTIRDRQCKSGALQQSTHVAKIGKRRNMRACPTLDEGFRLGHALPQFVKRRPAKHAPDKQAVRFQSPTRLNERSRQIINRLQGVKRDGSIESSIGERQEGYICNDFLKQIGLAAIQCR